MVSRRRGHNEGCLYFNEAKGLWVGFVTLSSADGKQIRKYVSSRVRSSARDKLEALQATVSAGLPIPNHRLNVGAFLERWLADFAPDLALSPNTLYGYRWAINNHLVPALGSRPLVKLSPADVVDMLRQKIAAGMARNTIMRLRSVLSAALDQAVLEGLVSRNVATITRPPRGGTVPQGRSLDIDEARSLLAAARGRRLEAGFVIMLMVGLRPGETLGLQWTDLDVTAGTIRIERSLKRENNQLRLGTTKTRKSRRVLALPAPVLEVLKRHRRRQAGERLKAGSAWQDNGLIFATTLGTLIDPSNLRREFNKVCASAHLGHWHPHELRHSAVSLLSASGVPIELVADVMGHSTTRTTEAVYRHSVLPTASGAVRAMDELFPD